MEASTNITIRENIRLCVEDLGRMAYKPAFDHQRMRQSAVIEQRTQHGATDALRTMHLLLVEHDPPVITVSKRRTARQNLIATSAQLEHAGVDVAETDRGGDITYHGPGQLVVYPIIDLNVFELRLHSYMRLLEQVVIETLEQFGIDAQRDAEATGVWVPLAEGRTAKICAMGVRVSRWVTMHGLALNVHTNLSHFNLIVPCGLAGRAVTSMGALLGDACPTFNDVQDALVRQFAVALRTQGQQRA